jgi:hypothetical protein
VTPIGLRNSSSSISPGWMFGSRAIPSASLSGSPSAQSQRNLPRADLHRYREMLGRNAQPYVFRFFPFPICHSESTFGALLPPFVFRAPDTQVYDGS